MNEKIVKTCIHCGPRTAAQVYFRKTRNDIECRDCNLRQQKEKKARNPEKAKQHRAKFRHIDRDPDTNLLKCSKCGIKKSVAEFNKYMFNIRYPYCRDCRLAATKDHHSKPESKRQHRDWYNSNYKPIATNSRLLKAFGITLDQYNEILEIQNHVCALCQNPERIYKNKSGEWRKLAVDHNHSTGSTRGLLCGSCNMALGLFKENRDRLLAAIAYLDKYDCLTP